MNIILQKIKSYFDLNQTIVVKKKTDGKNDELQYINQIEY